MNTFVQAVVAPQETTTENGMKSWSKTGSAVLDLFSKIGTARGRDLTVEIAAAMAEDKELTGRVILWARDIREGAGERQTVRNLLKNIEQTDPDFARRIMTRLPELGRWDDLLFSFDKLQDEAIDVFVDALKANDALAMKWAPREKSTKSAIAAKIRKRLGMSAKDYRKMIVAGTKVVEQQMSAKDFKNINYSHVPSLASIRYKKAFERNDFVGYSKYLAELSKPQDQRDSSVKVNAGAIFPHDVVVNARTGDKRHAIAQWEALPNYVGSASILPMIDTSGSMFTALAGKITALDVALSLGLYFSDKNSGPFKDVYLTFSGEAQINQLKGNLLQKLDQMKTDNKWGMNTNLHAAFDRILNIALHHNVESKDMPQYLIICSDMEFDGCVRNDDSALQMICRKYEESGYEVPKVIFWNLTSRNKSTPVKVGDNGTVLVSGFSPAILKQILDADAGEFEPYSMMMKVINQDRYMF